MSANNPPRLVVSLRWRGPRSAQGTLEFSTFAQSVMRHQAALHGRVIAFGFDELALDFPADLLEGLLELVTTREGDRVGLAACGIGLAQGELIPVLDAGVRVALSSGPGLERATRLARIADPGEVLLDPTLEAVQKGRLMTRGARLGQVAGQRVRGLRLDLRYPWRRSGTLTRLAESPLRGVTLEQFQWQPGQLWLLVAPRGAGGTRVLHELGTLPGRRALRIGPGALGEPLGALRSALGLATLDCTAPLGAEDQASLASLLAGEGLDLDASSRLLTGHSPDSECAVLLDDAELVDRDTLEVVVNTAQTRGFSVVARVSSRERLPDALGRLPLGGEVELPLLATAQAAELVAQVVRGHVPPDLALRWAKRGGGYPLATVEALRLGLERGELVWAEDGIVPRDRIAGRGRARSAAHWLVGRLRLLDADARKVLDALALHGGRAALAELASFFSLVGQSIDTHDTCRRLGELQWVSAAGQGFVTLPSTTLREALLARLSRDRRENWHRGWFELWGEGQRPMALAASAVHGLCAHQPALAQTVARRAAGAAQAVGLRDTARALALFAETADPRALETRGLVTPELVSDPVPASAFSSIVPTEIKFRGAEDMEPLLARVVQATDSRYSPQLAAVHQTVAELRRESVQSLAEDRRAGMASLRRGEIGEALRLLRSAKERAQRFGMAERCRATLGYAVGLAAAGRTSEALLDALEGLARAREARDARGSRACARFIAQLAESAGHMAVASAWQAAADEEKNRTPE